MAWIIIIGEEFDAGFVRFTARPYLYNTIIQAIPTSLNPGSDNWSSETELFSQPRNVGRKRIMALAFPQERNVGRKRIVVSAFRQERNVGR